MKLVRNLITKGFIVIISITALIGFGIYLFIGYRYGLIEEEISNEAQVVFSALSFLIIAISLAYQAFELSHQRKHMSLQSNAFAQQVFQSGFLTFLEKYQEQIETFSYEYGGVTYSGKKALEIYTIEKSKSLSIKKLEEDRDDYLSDDGLLWCLYSELYRKHLLDFVLPYIKKMAILLRYVESNYELPNIFHFRGIIDLELTQEEKMMLRFFNQNNLLDKNERDLLDKYFKSFEKVDVKGFIKIYRQMDLPIHVEMK